MQKLNRRFSFMFFGEDIKPLVPGNSLILALLCLPVFFLCAYWGFPYTGVIPGKHYPCSQDGRKARLGMRLGINTIIYIPML